MEVSKARVVYIFDQMRLDYDDLTDLWYSWLFSRLHFFISQDITDMWDRNHRQQVLDIGCGTGFQSFLYARAGARVVGLDISPELVKAAKNKSKFFSDANTELFDSHFDFVDRYNDRITEMISRLPRGIYVSPEFHVGDATELSFEDGSFDHVNCCGSVLSFIGDYERAIDEMSRVLKPGGTFVIELEAKFCVDMIWTVVDVLTGGRLGFESTIQDVVALFRPPFRRPVTVEYPFGEPSNPVYMGIRLFSKWAMNGLLGKAGLDVVKTRTIHSVTNLIPSTFLDSPSPSRRLKRAFNGLSRAEELLPFSLPGCSIVLTGTKAGSSQMDKGDVTDPERLFEHRT